MTKYQKSSSSKNRIDELALQSTRILGSAPSLIVHTLLFLSIFSLAFLGVSLDKILLILTTLVSLEAIYLALLIQISVNNQAMQLEAVSAEVEEIGEDVEEISRDIDEIQEEVEDLAEEVEEIGDDIEEDDREDAAEHAADMARIEKIEILLHELLTEVREQKKIGP
jgi:DNA repair exonuclease SbcCD ATPase subunit